MIPRRLILMFACLFMGVAPVAHAAEMRMAVTTSFENSGLADVLLPHVRADLNLDVRLIVVGTGQAIKLGRAGDVDALLVHSKQAELQLVADGHATHRREIMFNDFVLIGPGDDPASVAESVNAADSFARIARMKSAFVSRGDDSGTHRKELAIWQRSGVAAKSRKSAWYRAVGSGMGATLNTASAMNAYTLSDRASWLKFKNKANLKLLYSGDPTLFNQYAYLPISPAKHPHVKAGLAKQLEDWLASRKAQNLIGAYRLNNEPLFTPNARR